MFSLNEKTVGRTIIITWVVAFILNLAFWGGVIYVAVHFIRKRW